MVNIYIMLLNIFLEILYSIDMMYEIYCKELVRSDELGNIDFIIIIIMIIYQVRCKQSDKQTRELHA